MSLRFLLDTNILSAPFRPNPPKPLLDLLDQHADEAAIGSPVWHELQFGCRRLPDSRRRTALEGYLREVILPTYPILDYNRAAAEWHAQERARLTVLGRTPPFADGLIAAIAQVNGLTLVTANLSDFEDFRDLKVVNWLT